MASHPEKQSCHHHDGAHYHHFNHSKRIRQISSSDQQQPKMFKPEHDAMHKQLDAAYDVIDLTESEIPLENHEKSRRGNRDFRPSPHKEAPPGNHRQKKQANQADTSTLRHSSSLNPQHSSHKGKSGSFHHRDQTDRAGTPNSQPLLHEEKTSSRYQPRGHTNWAGTTNRQHSHHDESSAGRYHHRDPVNRAHTSNSGRYRHKEKSSGNYQYRDRPERLGSSESEHSPHEGTAGKHHQEQANRGGTPNPQHSPHEETSGKSPYRYLRNRQGTPNPRHSQDKEAPSSRHAHTQEFGGRGQSPLKSDSRIIHQPGRPGWYWSGKHHRKPKFREKVLRDRQWAFTDYGNSVRQMRDRQSHSFETFTVASYNILSQDLLEGNADLYVGCRPKDLKWKYRGPNLLAEIKHRTPDILCLQEMNSQHYHEEFLSEMKRNGYDGRYQKRSGSKLDGCAIFFKESKFELVKCNPVEYFVPQVDVLDRDNVALMLLLRMKSTKLKNPDNLLCIATTHLLFNPRRGDIKFAQLMLLLSELDKFAHKEDGADPWNPSYHPVILCGDFNLVPFCPLYRFLVDGVLPYEGIGLSIMSGQEPFDNRRYMVKGFLSHAAGLTHKCQFASVFAKRHEMWSLTDEMQGLKDSKASNSVQTNSQEGQEKQKDEWMALPLGVVTHSFRFLSAYLHTPRPDYIEVSTCHKFANCTVDYILFTGFPCGPDPADSPLKLVGSLTLPSDKMMKDVGSLPNDVVSSDHVLLMAEFTLH